MNRLQRWLRRHEYKRSYDQASRDGMDLENLNVMALLDFCIEWLPLATYQKVAPLPSIAYIMLPSRAPNVDVLIADIRDAVFCIERENELTSFEYPNRDIIETPVVSFMTDLDGYVVNRERVRDLLVDALRSLHQYLGLSVALETDLASFYQRTTHPLVVECFRLTLILMADSDHPDVYPLK